MHQRLRGEGSGTENGNIVGQTPDIEVIKRHQTAPDPLLQSRAPYHQRSYQIFFLLAVIRFAAALFSPIGDCDETFNYWEPMHYLLFGHGFQTWEYSPQFALRSYAFLLPYAAVARVAILGYEATTKLISVLAAYPPKIFAFYAVRVFQAILSAASETFLCASASRRFGPRAAQLLVMFLAVSPGLFRSSVEFLPSSFAMICLTVAFAAWMADKHFIAVFFVALASLLGWVFAAALAIPMALHILLGPQGLANFLKYSFVCGALILAAMIPIDSHFFGKPVVAPLNHILYNVFPKEGAGSHIFGVESWTFYILNLFLNCNIAFALLLAFPLILVVESAVLQTLSPRSTAFWERIVFLSPTYIVIGIFLLQPHKEERFLAPCYPFVALIASVATSDTLTILRQLPGSLIGSSSRERSRVWQMRGNLLSQIAAVFITVICISLSTSRIFMQVYSFRAPLRIYEHLSREELTRGSPKNRAPVHLSSHREVNICVGKEWHRFPTSFFLPQKRFRIRFIRAGFTGLMPKPFLESENGTRLMPSGVNQFNKEEPDQFYNWQAGEGCHYFIDLDLSHRNPGLRKDPDNPIPPESQEIVRQEPFLDSEFSRPGLRAFYIPGVDVSYAQYQLIRNSELASYND